MSFKTYKNYKDSEVEWLGKVPQHWNTPIIKELYDYRSEKVSDKIFPPLSVTKKGILPQLENAAKTDNNDVRKKVIKGDFVINSRSDRKGSCGVSKYDGSVSLIYHVLKPKNKEYIKFGHYLFRSVMFAEEFYKWGHGIVDDLWSTKYDEMKKINIPLPPKNEINSIVKFLDLNITKINQQLEAYTKFISLLEEKKNVLINQVVTKGLDPNVPMKDTGITWIGKIPQHWEIFNLNYFFNVTKLAGFEFSEYMEYIDDGEIIALRALNIKNNKLDLSNIVKISKSVSNKLPRSKLYKGDLIFSYVGSIGEVAIIDEDNTYHLAPNIAKISSKSNNINISYFLYYLSSLSGQREIKNNTSKTTQEVISMAKIRKLRVIYPNLTEQEDIVSYLDKKISKIDKTIEKVQENIDLLNEYKISLIHHAVTGKIDVRDEV